MAPAGFLGGVNRLLHRHSGPVAETRPSAAARLPEWCSKGARLQYISKSRGDVHIVEVEKIEDKPQAVLIRFEQDRRTWKRVPFSEVTVICDGTLRPMWKKTAGEAVAATVPEKPDGFVLEEVPDSEDEANMAQPVDPAEPFEGPDPAQSDEEAQGASPERPLGACGEARGAGLEPQAGRSAEEETAAPEPGEASAGGAGSPAVAPASPEEEEEEAEEEAAESPPVAPVSPEEAAESPTVAPVSPEEEAADGPPAAPASPERVPEDPPLMPVEGLAGLAGAAAAAAGRMAASPSPAPAVLSPRAAGEPEELGVPGPAEAAAPGAAGDTAVAPPPGAAEAVRTSIAQAQQRLRLAPGPKRALVRRGACVGKAADVLEAAMDEGVPSAPSQEVPRRIRKALKQAACAPAPPPPDVEGPILLDDLPPEPAHEALAAAEATLRPVFDREEAAVVDPYLDVSLKVSTPAEIVEQISSTNSRTVFLDDGSSEAPRKARRRRRRSTSGRARGHARGVRPVPPPAELAPRTPGRQLPEVPASLLVLPEVVASPRKSRSAANAAVSKVLKATKAVRAATETALGDEGLEVVRATLAFEPVNPHEVRIKQGDKVQILEHHASGWTYCRNLATTAGAATTGWAPAWIVPEKPEQGKRRRKKPRLDA